MNNDSNSDETSDYDETVETIQINQDFIHFANNLKEKYNLKKELIYQQIVKEILEQIEMKKIENT
tara:strand:- start:416 stop:610 length:195 start_codon:yes stop_codon:yes gene_type:complete